MTQHRVLVGTWIVFSPRYDRYELSDNNIQRCVLSDPDSKKVIAR